MGTQEEIYAQVCGPLSSSFHTDATPGHRPGAIPKGLGLVILEAASVFQEQQKVGLLWWD